MKAEINEQLPVVTAMMVYCMQGKLKYAQINQ